LYGLARIYTVLERAKVDTQTLCLPKAVALFQAALMVDARNGKAANELGVLLGQFGQLEDAKRVLLHSIVNCPGPEVWHNLSVVHQRLGEVELARSAYREWENSASRRNPEGGQVQSVQWVDTRTFSAARPAPGP
jgi:tetratricopeptide (TPR) repeat protein